MQGTDTPNADALGRIAARVREAPRCPYCGLVMGNREADEQGACNDCSGGAYDPRDSIDRGW